MRSNLKKFLLRPLMAALIFVTASVAGCSGRGGASPVPSAAASPPAEWHRLAAECPVLRNPPYGLPARGKLIAPMRVDSAEKYEVICDYPTAAHLPLLKFHVVIARAADGYLQTEQDYSRDRAAAGRLVGFDFVDLPQVGDAAYAIYDQGMWMLQARARSGNAAVQVQILMPREVAESWSVTAPLQQQAPVLAAVTNDFLSGLR